MKTTAALFFLSLTAFADEKINFEMVTMNVGKKAIHAQIADDEAKREHGLMFVKQMPEDQGMLFVFNEERVLNFWMKNTLIPLSIGFFNNKGVLVDVQEMKPSQSIMVARPPTYESKSEASFALEMNKDWFKKNKITTGSHLELTAKSKSPLLNKKLSSTRH